VLRWMRDHGPVSAAPATATFTAADRAAIPALRHDTTCTPAERNPVAVLLLSDAGWSPPRIAALPDGG
jgi:hypothetical protein